MKSSYHAKRWNVQYILNIWVLLEKFTATDCMLILNTNPNPNPSKVLFYVKIHVKLPQVFAILREYSCNIRNAKFHI